MPQRLDEFTEGNLAVLIEIKVSDELENLVWILAKLDGDSSKVVIIDEARSVTIEQLKDDPVCLKVLVRRHLLLNFVGHTEDRVIWLHFYNSVSLFIFEIFVSSFLERRISKCVSDILGQVNWILFSSLLLIDLSDHLVATFSIFIKYFHGISFAFISDVAFDVLIDCMVRC